MRKVVLMSAVVGALAFAPSAQAAIPSVLGPAGDAIPCVDNDGGTPGDPSDDQRRCGSSSPRSTVASPVDGVPIDINVAFPPEPDVGPDGPYPLIGVFHGYGGGKFSFTQMRRFTDRGYAVFTMTDRGFRESCGSGASRTAAGTACDAGYVRLLDSRYEVRDFQDFAAQLSDQGVIDPQRIGAVGGSYGGGMSMALAALKNRVMNPDGSLSPWEDDDGTPMQIAGATPDIPWTDLAYSLVPNGSTYDYVTDAPYTGRFGIMKQSLIEGLYFSGQAAPGYYTPAAPNPNHNPAADLAGWRARLTAGEPYDGDPTATDILEEITTYHSSYGIDHSVAPAPLMISNGYTDDLFPADEAIRFYNRTKEQYPGAAISMLFGDFGHQRSLNRAVDSAARDAAQDAWLDHYVKGEGPVPFQGVTSFTMTCPGAGGASGGPYTAPNWASIAKGEVRFADPTAKTIVPGSGDFQIAGKFDPVGAGVGGLPPGEGFGACNRVSGADQAGVATYRLPSATGSGYTLLGSPTVIADISSGSANSELAARLLDVAPDGTQTLVDRALYRPQAGSGRQLFQLHPSGWHFAPGHTPKLELLPQDSGGAAFNSYGRPANGQGAITVSNLELRLPALEKPGAADGAVKSARPKVVPAGYTLARDFAALPQGVNAELAGGKVTTNGKFAFVRVDSPAAWDSCHASVSLLAPPGAIASAKKGKKRVVIAKNKVPKAIAGGTRGVVKLKLTKKARKALTRKKGLKVTVQLTTAEQDGSVVAKRKLVKKKGKKKKGKKK
jgi:predicted acyl esterase